MIIQNIGATLIDGKIVWNLDIKLAENGFTNRRFVNGEWLVTKASQTHKVKRTLFDNGTFSIDIEDTIWNEELR